MKRSARWLRNSIQLYQDHFLFQGWNIWLTSEVCWKLCTGRKVTHFLTYKLSLKITWPGFLKRYCEEKLFLLCVNIWVVGLPGFPAATCCMVPVVQSSMVGLEQHNRPWPPETAQNLGMLAASDPPRAPGLVYSHGRSMPGPGLWRSSRPTHALAWSSLWVGGTEDPHNYRNLGLAVGGGSSSNINCFGSQILIINAATTLPSPPPTHFWTLWGSLFLAYFTQLGAVGEGVGYMWENVVAILSYGKNVNRRKILLSSLVCYFFFK